MSNPSAQKPVAQPGKGTILANGKPTETQLPCSIEQFLLGQSLLPRSVVVEHNGKAVAPSEFTTRSVQAGDRLEIVQIVAGG
jgi:thiamine biosynthesis protein ThiS